jgi:hypothetical protein
LFFRFRLHVALDPVLGHLHVVVQFVISHRSGFSCVLVRRNRVGEALSLYLLEILRLSLSLRCFNR